MISCVLVQQFAICLPLCSRLAVFVCQKKLILFLLQDCGKAIGNHFFLLDSPTPESSSPLHLCEHDFFRRRSLLCHVCGGALRGDYVMAVGHKYHLEHFTCSICPRVFQADDNYYERDGAVYCHFHFSTLFADRCEGCDSAILRQFIENLRNGRHEHWHPECYMIHKFWNIRLAAESAQPASAVTDPGPYIWKDDSDLTPELLKSKQSAVENKVFRIWTVLSEYEEVSAACISDMLQYATAGSTLASVLAASRLIYRVQVLFSAVDDLRQHPPVARALGKEPKTLCKNIVNFLTTLPGSVLSSSPPASLSQSRSNPASSSKDILDLVTSMAHYLKLLIQFGLDSALLQDQLDPDMHAVEHFLDYLSSHNTPPVLSRQTLIPNITDQCISCRRGIEERCARLMSSVSEDRRDRRWHLTPVCFACAKCQRSLVNEIPEALWSDNLRVILCSTCATPADQCRADFAFVSRLNQYSFLLKVALQRVYKTVDTLASSQDPLKRVSSLDKHEPVEGYVNTLTDIRRLRSTRFKRAISDAKGKQARRSKSVLQNESRKGSTSSQSLHSSPNGSGSPSDSLQHHKSSNKRPSNGRDGAAVPSPASSSSPAPKNSDNIATPRRTPTSSSEKPDILFGEKYLKLDDIPRIVAAEQAREQRPNAFRHQRQSSLKLASGPVPKLIQQPSVTQSHVGPQRNSEESASLPPPQQQHRQLRSAPSDQWPLVSNGATAAAAATAAIAGDGSGLIDRSRSVTHSFASSTLSQAGAGIVKYFSELSAAEYLAVRRKAYAELQPLVAEFFTEAEYLDMAGEARSPASPGSTTKVMGFFEKFGKAFTKSNGPSQNSGADGNFGGGIGSATPASTEKLKRKGSGNNTAPPGVFKLNLDVLVDRTGTNSELGVSAGVLKVPSFLDDVISSMRRKGVYIC